MSFLEKGVNPVEWLGGANFLGGERVIRDPKGRIERVGKDLIEYNRDEKPVRVGRSLVTFGQNGLPSRIGTSHVVYTSEGKPAWIGTKRLW